MTYVNDETDKESIEKDREEIVKNELEEDIVIEEPPKSETIANEEFGIETEVIITTPFSANLSGEAV